MQAAGIAETQRLKMREVAWIYTRHLISLALPVTSLAFVLTGPHPWYLALPFLLPLVASVLLDYGSGPERRQPVAEMPARPFNALLYLLVALQIANVVGGAWLVSQSGLAATDAWVAVFLLGINSGYSAIVVAHELIHRSQRSMQSLGRLLLCTVLYEHFSTEHIRGHHSRVGTDDDPATARFGETFRQFWRRTVPAQFRSAWHLEAKRLGDESMSLWDKRMLRNRVLHGLIVEWSIAVLLLALLGPAAFVFFVLQALVAIRALEAVNYFEHWGLRRSQRRVRPVDSWDTESAFTYYTLVGLSRHADHHAYAARPYQQLRVWEESPKLPVGYFGMVEMVWFRNRRLREQLTAELQRRHLGPFAEMERA